MKTLMILPGYGSLTVMPNRTTGHFLALAVKRLAHRFNIQVRRHSNVAPVDLTRHLDLSPREAAYLAGARPALVRVSTSRCIHMLYLASQCDKQSTSPFVATLLDYARGVHKTYHGSKLEMFYRLFQPANGAELMGFPSGANTMLAACSAHGAPKFFFLNQPANWPSENLKYRQRMIEVENRLHGARLGHEAGWSFYGPVSEKKGALEFKRLVAVYNHMKQRGFYADPTGLDNITGFWLCRNNSEWRLYGSGGQHRLAAAAALGISDIVVQIEPLATGGVIDRSDVDCWPLVKKGEITPSQAISLFDRIYAGKPPDAAGKWMRYLASLPE